MDKTRKIRRYAALSAAFVFAFSNASLCTFNEVSASEDPFSYEIEYTEKRSYHDYYSEYSSQKTHPQRLS